jgi:tryptophan synthase alpha chain
MTLLDDRLAGLRARGEGAFAPFLVAGDPDADTCLAVAGALAPHADLFEIGLPFSDPPADGPVIQAADRRALAAGATTESSLRLIEAIRTAHDKPIALLVYYNLILSAGIDTFYARARAAGVDAVLVADVPIEEARPAIDAACAHGVSPVFIVSALTPRARLVRILEDASGYLYLVARIGVTGERASVERDLSAVIRGVKAETPLPILAGFGLSSPEHVRSVLAAGADGAITGSALVRLIEENLADRDRMIERVAALAGALKRATRPEEEVLSC